MSRTLGILFFYQLVGWVPRSIYEGLLGVLGERSTTSNESSSNTREFKRTKSVFWLLAGLENHMHSTGKIAW